MTLHRFYLNTERLRQPVQELSEHTAGYAYSNWRYPSKENCHDHRQELTFAWAKDLAVSRVIKERVWLNALIWKYQALCKRLDMRIECEVRFEGDAQNFNFLPDGHMWACNIYVHNRWQGPCTIYSFQKYALCLTYQSSILNHYSKTKHIGHTDNPQPKICLIMQWLQKQLCTFMCHLQIADEKWHDQTLFQQLVKYTEWRRVVPGLSPGVLRYCMVCVDG